MWSLEKNWKESLKEKWVDLLVIALIGTSVCIGIYQRDKEKSHFVESMEIQSKCIAKLAENQEKIMRNLGYISGNGLEKLLKKVDLDSAGN